MPTERMGPPPGASPPMRMTASWSGSNDPTVYKSVARRCAPVASSPRILNRPTGTVQTLKLCKKPLSQVIIAPRAQASRRCETQATLAASRQAVLPFRSLDPFRALREPDRRRRDEERLFQLRTKNRQQTKNDHLTGKAPYRFESGFLQQRVSLSPASAFEGREIRLSERVCAAAWRPGRQRRARCFDIAPTSGNISVGPYSSTAAADVVSRECQ